MGVLRNTEPWVKPFRDQVRASTAPDWWVLNSRGRMRLQVKGLGSVALPYPWTLEGSTQALPRIQQIFKRYAGAQITLAAAALCAVAFAREMEAARGGGGRRGGEDDDDDDDDGCDGCGGAVVAAVDVDGGGGTAGD